MTLPEALRAALFLPCLGFLVAAILMSFANPAPTPLAWLARHSFTFAAGIGTGLCWPSYIRGLSRR